MFSQYGIEGLDNFVIYISQRHYTSACQSEGGTVYEPKAGDIIKAKYNSKLYEVIHIKEVPVQFLQRQHTWQFTVTVFKDEHMYIPTSAESELGPDLSAYVNKDSDIFDVSTAVDQEVSAINYDPPTTETTPDTIWGDF